MEALTKLDALKWTWIIWRDVAESYIDLVVNAALRDETGEISVENSADKYDVAHTYGKKFRYGCPCCTYMDYNTAERANCVAGMCILREVWGSVEAFACEESDSSPYNRYSDADDTHVNIPIRYKYASQIADGAWQLYIEECKAQGVTPVDKFFTPITDKT